MLFSRTTGFRLSQTGSLNRVRRGRACLLRSFGIAIAWQWLAEDAAKLYGHIESHTQRAPHQRVGLHQLIG